MREFPDPGAARRYAALVGLDEVKERLQKESRLLLDPESLAAWSTKHHGKKTAIINLFRDRPPLFIFEGDVGTGKTALAETFGDMVAREANIRVALYALSLTARGTGAVGEMTSLISAAFSEVKEAARKASGRGGKHNSGIVLLIDEADALAQSRELGQMHHEDRAGVNALIRGVDDFATGSFPPSLSCVRIAWTLLILLFVGAQRLLFAFPGPMTRSARRCWSPRSQSWVFQLNRYTPSSSRQGLLTAALTDTPIRILCSGSCRACCWRLTRQSPSLLTWRKKSLSAIRRLLLSRNMRLEQSHEYMVSFRTARRPSR